MSKQKKSYSNESSSDASDIEDSVNTSTIDSSVVSEASKTENEEFPATDEEDTEASDHNESIQSNESNASDEINIRKKSRAGNRILDSDSESEEDEQVKEIINKRKTLYEMEPEGDESCIMEDEAFSKPTRKSFGLFSPKNVKPEPVSISENSAGLEQDESDSDIIISDDEDAEKENSLGQIKFESVGRSLSQPLRESLNVSIKEEFNSSISEKLSSTINDFKESSSVFDTSEKPRKVSKSFYTGLLADKESKERRLSSMKQLQATGKLSDGGKKIKEAIDKVEKEIQDIKNELKNLIIDPEESVKSQIAKSFEASNVSDEDYENEVPSKPPLNYIAAEDVQPKYLGKVGMKNFETQKALTVERLQMIQENLNKRPADDALSEPPKYLKLSLLKHQLHALAFMTWREEQKPRGGILADDMGLGKTLTIISLVLKQLQYEEENDIQESDSDTEEQSEWIGRGSKDLKRGGTLVVCPASLLKQWEDEIKTKVKRGALEVNLFHGPKRCYKAKQLIKFDVVITTYQIIVSEFKSEGCVYGVKWDRIVLDEGHVIRNYRSKQSEAVCALTGKCRWVLTGTPIQNKEFDIYAAIKFLRCTPFDDLKYWKTWIEVRGGGTSQRLQTLLKSIMLRRTKQQLQESGEITSLPEKIYEEVIVNLNHEERKVYNKMMAFSQAIFAQFLKQYDEKHQMNNYDKERLHKLHKQFARMNNVNREVQAHEILTLLLRLRQICCHPGLIKQMLENHDMLAEQLDVEENESHNASDTDLLTMLQKMKIGDDADETTMSSQLTLESEVFNMDIPSTKIDKMMDVLREKILETDDKAIIVSQFVSYLNIIKGMLEIECVGYCELNGSIPVKDRNDIVVNFNKQTSNIKVMLLSITAGGVGLNLVGANYLFIMDPHWNPQIEQQAQDRIYRFGQTKDVKIIKFICENTIEEKILQKQKEKLEIATSTLTGAKRNATKLTIEDLKDLFGMKM